MKKIFAMIIIASLVITSCSKEEQKVADEVKPKYVGIETITKKSFSEDIKLAGKVSPITETSISPLTSGTINKVNVNIGDNVKSGDVLATIDTTTNLTDINLNNAVNAYNNTLSVYSATKESLQKNLDSAKLQYDNAVISRDNTYSSTQKQLELAQAQLDAVKTQKSNTSKTTNTSITIAEESLNNAKLSLDNFERNYTETMNGFDVKKKSLIDNFKVAIDNSVAVFDSSLYSIDTTLGVTDSNKDFNNDFENNLAVKSPKLKVQAEDIFRDANISFTSLKSKYRQGLSDEEALALYVDTLSVTEKMVSLFDKMISVLDNSVSSESFTDLTLSGLKSSMKSYQSQVLSLKSTLVSLNSSLNDLNNTISSTKTSLATQKSTLEQAVKISQASLDNAKASSNTSIDSASSTENTTKIQLESTITTIKSSRETADNAVKIALNQYEAAKANYNSSLASTKSQLDSASGQKNSLNQQLENAFIKAPFDGTITAKNVEVGSSVSQSTQSFKIANSKEKIIKIDVTAENIKYLKIGDEVKLGKNDKTATGTISVVGAAADDTTKMFKVEVNFSNEEFKNYVVLGDFVDVYIKKNIGEEKIVVPFSSLIVGSNDTYNVYVVGSGSLVEERKVVIGESNSSEVVVNSGLKEGDKIIVSGALNISIGDKVEGKTE